MRPIPIRSSVAAAIGPLTRPVWGAGWHPFRWVGWWLGAVGLCLHAESRPEGEGKLKAGDLFDSTRIWTAHFTFSPEQWQAMEPVGDGHPQAGIPGVPGVSLAEGWMRAGDRDQDGRLSASEFRGLAETWFQNWDTAQRGNLGTDELRSGLGLALGYSSLGDLPTINAPVKGFEFNYVHAGLEFAGRTFGDVAVRYKGYGTFLESRGSLKRSLKIDLKEFTQGVKLAGMNQFDFHNGVTDPSGMGEVLAYRLHRDAGVPAPRTAYSRVYVTVPGTYEHRYLGLYSLVEDVGTRWVQDRFGTRDGGLFKPVTPTLFTDLGNEWKNYRLLYDPRGRVSDDDKLRVIAFAHLVSHADDAEFARRLGDFVEVDEFARYLAVTALISDLDGLLGPGQNLYLYVHPVTHRFWFVPWDQDQSWGRFGATAEQTVRLSLEKPWKGTNRFLERVFRVDAFHQLYRARLEEFCRTLCVPERIGAQVDELGQVLRPAVAEESAARLAEFDRAVAGEPESEGGFGRHGTGRPIKAFLNLRCAAVRDQLAGRTRGEELAGPESGPPAQGGKSGPAEFLAPAFVKELDADRNGMLTRAEFTAGFARWFARWEGGRGGGLTADQLRDGIDTDLIPPAKSGSGPGH